MRDRYNYSSEFTSVVSRYLALGIVLSVLIFSVSRSFSEINKNSAQTYFDTSFCFPGEFRSNDQLIHSPLRLISHVGDVVKIPVYSTHDLENQPMDDVTRVIIIQHGNLRNANDYFCGTVNSLYSSTAGPSEISSTLIVAPQFLIHGDSCWVTPSSSRQIVNELDFNTWCGFPIWTSEGWKDGHMSLGPSITKPLFSYSVFDNLIEFFANPDIFPNIRNITLFGFSAGAQV